MDQTKILAAILAVFVVVSAAQTFQLNELRTKVSDGKVSLGELFAASEAAGSNSGGIAAASGGSVPKSLASLPQQVGGC